jgi:hypothetical protein
LKPNHAGETPALRGSRSQRVVTGKLRDARIAAVITVTALDFPGEFRPLLD